MCVHIHLNNLHICLSVPRVAKKGELGSLELNLPDLMVEKELRSSGRRSPLKLLSHLSISRIEVLKNTWGGEHNTYNTNTDEEVVHKGRGGDIRMGAEE